MFCLVRFGRDQNVGDTTLEEFLAIRKITKVDGPAVLIGRDNQVRDRVDFVQDKIPQKEV